MGNKNSRKGKSGPQGLYVPENMSDEQIQGLYVPENMSDEQIQSTKKLYKEFAKTKGVVGPKDFKMMLFHIGHVLLGQHLEKGNYVLDSIPGWRLQLFIGSLPKECQAEELAMQLLDADGGGTVDINEFLEIIDKVQSNRRSDRFELYFMMGSKRNPTLGADGLKFFKNAFSFDPICKSLTAETTLEDFLKIVSDDEGVIKRLSMQCFLKEDEEPVKGELYKEGSIYILSLTGKIVELKGLSSESDVLDLKKAYQDLQGIPPKSQDYWTKAGIKLQEGTKLGTYDLSGPVTFIPSFG